MPTPSTALSAGLLPGAVSRIQAAPTWQQVDFISDLHLDAHEPATFKAWAHYMAHTHADALFILGDLFEVWVGDDTQDPFALQCLSLIQRTSQRLPVYFICGNRDFLLGADALKASGMQGLSDPTVLALGEQHILLSHGDSLCLDDHDYLAFRAQVRQPAWQAQFLAQPLAQRQATAQAMRAQSEARKRTHTNYADVDTHAARAWLQATQCQVLLHGHTHHPAVHDLGDGLQRWVLSDWHASQTAPRGEVVTWRRAEAGSTNHGLVRRTLPPPLTV
jgi:UDP-2,3-diacylglucosamine hydrolase